MASRGSCSLSALAERLVLGSLLLLFANKSLQRIGKKTDQPGNIYFHVSLCECAIVRYNGTKVYFAKREHFFRERNVNSCRRDNRFILRVPFTNWSETTRWERKSNRGTQ